MTRLEKMRWHRDGEGSVPLDDLDLLLKVAWLASEYAQGNTRRGVDLLEAAFELLDDTE